MPCTRLMLMRHAEEGDPAAGELTVDAGGRPDARSLSVRGWQRAGALVRWLAPHEGRFVHPLLARPVALFAAAPTLRSPSRRPADTLGPLAAVLGLPVRQDHGSDDAPSSLLAAAAACDGPVLVCWRHEQLPLLARARAPQAGTPKWWPEDCFDLLWVCDAQAGAWRFGQLPMRLLAGDRETVLR